METSLKDFAHILEISLESALTNAQKINPIPKDDHRILEKMYYPFFNIALLRNLRGNEVIGIGQGQISRTDYEIVDCLLVFKNADKIAIEIKGPDIRSNLLSGVADSYSKKIETIIKFTPDVALLLGCLKSAYLGTKKDLQADSVIGDIIKISNFLVNNLIICGYSIGLLKYTATSEDMKQNYIQDLNRMVACIRKYINRIEIVIHNPKDIPNLNILISIIEIKKTSI